jgi:hypothetical protein
MEVIGHMLGQCRCTNKWRRLQSQAFKQFAARHAAPIPPIARRALGVLPAFISTFDRFQYVRPSLASCRRASRSKGARHTTDER